MVKRTMALAALFSALAAGSAWAAEPVEPDKHELKKNGPSIPGTRFVDDDAEDDGPKGKGAQGQGLREEQGLRQEPQITTNAPHVDLNQPGLQWLGKTKPAEEEKKKDGAASLDAYCDCTMVTVKLNKIYVQGNNESGNDEWRFKVKLGSETFYFPSATGYYTIPSSASFPYEFNLDQVIHNSKYYLTNGQSIGMNVEVEAREIDTFVDDVSRAYGAQGFTIPVDKLWYNIVATGDTPVQFQLEVSTRPASKYD